MKQNFIAGEWMDGSSVSRNINPSNTDDVVGEFARADRAQVDAAIESARLASASWSRTNISVRSDILQRISVELFARREELGTVLSREEGKVLSEGIGEVVRASQVFGFFAGECLRLSGEKLPSTRPGIELDITREPVGVVGIITPWNYPAAIPAWKIAPALCYGNCVVFKPAEITPASAHALTEIIVRAGVPSGVFNLVMGKGSVVGEAMTDSNKIDAISFTGSLATGRRIAAACVAGDPMKKVQLEMGGKNPLIVLDDADLDVAVDCAVNGAFYSTGQRCTASSRMIVTEGIHDKFVAAVRERVAKLIVGDALLPESQIGPVVNDEQLQIDLNYIELGTGEGAKLAFGGTPEKRATAGHYLAPALFTEVQNGMRIAQEEIFGPVAAVIRVKDYDEALAVANDTVFGLSSGICTTSLKFAHDFKRNSTAGMVMVNLPTAGVDYHAPFGGRKGSSYGAREQGRYAQEFYTIIKTSYTSPGI